MMLTDTLSSEFLSLPPELLVQILSLLELSDYVSLISSHSSFYSYHRSSASLQYRFLKQASFELDNPHSTSSASESLRLLKARENGWETLNIDWSKTVKMKHEPSGIYDLTEGIYVSGDSDKRTLHYLRLANRAEDEMEWEHVKVEAQIVDIALAIYEHDLLAIVTTRPHPTIGHTHIIEARILQMSTGKPHPLARSPVLYVEESPFPRPAIGMEIVGDHLALVTTQLFTGAHPRDYFRVFEWKTGQLRLEVPAPHHTYSGLVFLSLNLVCLPNSRSNSLDVYAIPADIDPNIPTTTPQLTTTTMHPPSSADFPPEMAASGAQDEPTPPRPIASLGLPPLARDQLILTITCRSEPNPTASGTPGPFYPHPFSTDPAHSLMLFNLRCQSLVSGTPGTFSIIVRRDGLLRALEAHLVPMEENGGDPILSGAVDQDGVVEAEGGSDQEGEDDDDPVHTAFNHNGWPIFVLPNGELVIGAPVVHRASSMSKVCVPWAKWGKDVARVVKVAEGGARWITTSMGGRVVVVVRSAEEEPEPEEEEEEEEEEAWVNDDEVTTDVDEDKDEMGGTDANDGGGDSEDEGGDAADTVVVDRPSKRMVIMDFNEWRVRRVCTQRQREIDDYNNGYSHLHSSKGKGPYESWKKANSYVPKPPTVIEHEALLETLETTLPCMTRNLFPSGDVGGFEGVLMDDERLLGLRTNREGTVDEIVVMHIGAGI